MVGPYLEKVDEKIIPRLNYALGSSLMVGY